MRPLALGGAIVAVFLAAALLSFVWTPYDAAALDIPDKLRPRRRPTGSAPTISAATSSR